MIFPQFTRKQVQAARETVADFFAEHALAVRRENPYADHVSEDTKEALLQNQLDFALEIRRGRADHNFTVWQRMEYALTGECTPFLPASPNTPTV